MARAQRLAPAPPALEGGAPIREEFLTYARPQILDEEVQEVVDTLRSGWLGTGPKVERFQAAFREYKEAPFAHAVSSCTAGLHLACLGTGIGPGDEVVTSPMTFAATTNAILHAGAVPVLADVDRRTMNVDPAEIERRITRRTRGIVPVHFAGRPCDLDAIMDVARRHDLVVIEDCAHAIETEHRGRKAGTIGDAAAFSFYATKNVCTGEGGMLVTTREDVHDRIGPLAVHGLSRDAWQRYGRGGFRHYVVEELGYKYNMTDLQASIGLHQLGRVEANWERRREIWARFHRDLADLPCTLPLAPEAETRHAYHMYNLLLDLERLRVDRDHVLHAMTAENIGVGVHYHPVHLHPFYARTFGYRPEDFPSATWIGERTLSLPLTPALSDSDVDDVIAATHRVLEFYAR